MIWCEGARVCKGVRRCVQRVSEGASIGCIRSVTSFHWDITKILL